MPFNKGIRIAPKPDAEQLGRWAKIGIYPPDLEKPDALMQYSEKELRKEYSRLRSIARKRLERFGQSEFAKESALYRRYKNMFQPVDTYKSKAAIAAKLRDVHYYLERKTGSLSGYKSYLKDTIESFHEKGMTWVTMKNIHSVFEFLEFSKAQATGNMYDSERVLNILRAGTDKGWSPDQIKESFDHWYKNYSDLEEIPENPNMKRKSARDLRTNIRPPQTTAARRQSVSRRKKNAPRR